MRGNSLIASAQFGYYLYDSIIGFNTDGVVGRTDVVTQRITGESGDGRGQADFSMKHTRGAVTWYKPNWFYGNHELKAGLEYSAHKKVLGTEVEQIGELPSVLPERRALPVLAFNAPVPPSVYANMLASYVRDSWTVGRRLTLNLGLRFDRRRRFAGAVPRRGDASLGRHLPRRVLLERGAQDLEQRGAAPACGVRSVGRWQDGDQGRVGALRSHAPARAGRAAAWPGTPSRTPSTGGTT